MNNFLVQTNRYKINDLIDRASKMSLKEIVTSCQYKVTINSDNIHYSAFNYDGSNYLDINGFRIDLDTLTMPKAIVISHKEYLLADCYFNNKTVLIHFQTDQMALVSIIKITDGNVSIQLDYFKTQIGEYMIQCNLGAKSVHIYNGRSLLLHSTFNHLGEIDRIINKAIKYGFMA